MFEFGINGGSFNDSDMHPAKVMPALGKLAPFVRWVRLWRTITSFSDNPTKADWSICRAWRAIGVDVILENNLQGLGNFGIATLKLWADQQPPALSCGVRVMEITNEWDNPSGQWNGGIPLLAQTHTQLFESWTPKGYLICAGNTMSGIGNYDKLFAASPNGQLACHFIGNHSYFGNPKDKQSADVQQGQYAVAKNKGVIQTEDQQHQELTSVKPPWDAKSPTQWAADTYTMLRNQQSLDGVFVYFQIDKTSDQHAGPCGLTIKVNGVRQPNEPYLSRVLQAMIDGPFPAAPTYSISGQVLKGTAPMAGINVWIDLTNQGTEQPADPQTSTDSKGNYSFSGLAGGATYIVRQVLPTGVKQITPANNLGIHVLVSGANVPGNNFVNQ